MRGERRSLLWAGLACLLLAATVTAGLLHLYGASRARLDEALGDRLLAVARGLATVVDAERVFALSLADTSQAAWADSLAERYGRLARADDLSEITLCDPEGRVLLSTTASLPAGQPNDWGELDRAPVELSLAGEAAASRLYSLGTIYQKSAHAPVVLRDPWVGGGVVVAILTVSGSPDFFDSLAALRRGAWVTGVVVLAVLVLVLALLYRLSMSLGQARASLVRQENLAAMGRMTAGIAHEVRNPLGIIRGAGEHLARVLEQAGIEDEVAAYIPEEVDRLDRVLTGYLAFGRDTAAEGEVFELAPVVNRGARLLDKVLGETGVTLTLRTDGPAASVMGDPLRLQQVLLNLLLNARDAMPGGGTIEVALEVTDGHARLTVTDTGCGLQESAERLFEPFRTTKEKGSGLGLALSRRIANDMGGELMLTDRTDGSGAVATLTLPLVAGGAT